MKLSGAAKDELASLEKEITVLESFKDNVEVVDAFFEIRRENIMLEAELSEVQQKLEHFTGIKSRLDEQVRKENERLAEEKRMKTEALIKSLLEEIKKPKMQETILKKCIGDLGKISPAANQASL